MERLKAGNTYLHACSHACTDILKAGKAHLPALPCTFMVRQRQGAEQQISPGEESRKGINNTNDIAKVTEGIKRENLGRGSGCKVTVGVSRERLQAKPAYVSSHPERELPF